MSGAQSPSTSSSPSPSDSPANSILSWESVTLSPAEVIALQYEHELQQLEDAFVVVKQNKNGVDLDPATRKAAGRVVIEVRNVRGLQDAIAQHPVLGVADAHPSVYVSTVITPSSGCEKSTRKHLRTTPVAITDGRAQWNEALVYEGVKTTQVAVKIAVNSSAGVIADVALGEAEVNLAEFLDQQPHTRLLDLKLPASSALTVDPVSFSGKLQLSITFEYNAQSRHDQKVAALNQKKKEHEEWVDLYRKTAPLVMQHERHPASYGAATARAELYVPGNRFRADVHHPAAITRAPLPEKTRVITPFGRGIVVSFRSETKMYIVQLDKDPAAKKATVAYIRQVDVTEEPNVPHLKMYMKVSTPYGDGEIVEVRPHDDVIVVKTAYANMFMHRKDVKLPEKKVEDMKNKDLIDEAVKLTEQGNEQFRSSEFEEAVYSYLRALAFLQRVDQSAATHKEKAIILQTMIRCHLNIGTCKLKVDAFVEAEIACSNALNVLTVLSDNRHGNVATWMGRLGLSEQLMFEEWPSKARFRRAKACVKLGKYLDARNDLLVAVKLNAKDKACRTLLDQVTRLISKQKSEEKKAWGGIFENAGSVEAPSDVSKDTQLKSSGSPSSALKKPVKPPLQPHAREADASPPNVSSWFMSTKALATASLVTAGVAALAVVALKQNRS